MLELKPLTGRAPGASYSGDLWSVWALRRERRAYRGARVHYLLGTIFHLPIRFTKSRLLNSKVRSIDAADLRRAMTLFNELSKRRCLVINGRITGESPSVMMILSKSL